MDEMTSCDDYKDPDLAAKRKVSNQCYAWYGMCSKGLKLRIINECCDTASKTDNSSSSASKKKFALVMSIYLHSQCHSSFHIYKVRQHKKHAPQTALTKASR